MLLLCFLRLVNINYILFEYNIHKVPLHYCFNKDMMAKIWLKNKDRRRRKYSNISITVNLGQEVLNERDVLSLIAHSIREKYYKFVHNRQNKPITNYLHFMFSTLLAFFAMKCLIIPLLSLVGSFFVLFFQSVESWISALIVSMVLFLKQTMSSNALYCHVFQFFVYIAFYIWIVKILKAIRKKTPYFSVPYKSLDRLEALCERVSSSLNEEKGIHPQYSSSFLNFSFGKAGKSKSTPIATVRELEQELMEIINNINGVDCPNKYCAQFIIIFDELDKIASNHKKGSIEPDGSGEEITPSFDTSVKGFTEAMPYEERKQNVLRLLANMKLFITSVKAKCVFISGHELFDASLADLSDREFAISSIFNGVLNVSSFLSPEHEESDVSSMTEVYLATMLLPESFLKNKFQGKVKKEPLHQPWSLLKKKIVHDLSKISSFWPVSSHKSYLKQKVKDNIQKNGVLKDELPSLRWYNQYLMEVHILNNEETFSNEKIKEREYEIRHVIEFLRNFCIYLSHISNGTPKKIATYFEKYVRVNYDTIKQFNWHDEIEVGRPTEDDVRKQCVLYFAPDSQKLVNFVHYIAAPVMNAITNEVSHYGDKLLVSSSFILDQIYKYHGKGFSWRNLEQMPELLNTNKNPELRDSLASIMEFLLQTHVTTISSSIFQYKFHKQIAEEISMLSKISEEAAAIFNFTLNESETVKRYNARLLWNYLNLTNQTKDKNQKDRYCGVLERLHENQGDIYFSEEDYYRAIHEYRSALQYIDESNISPQNLIAYLKCSLKVGMSYEYRHTFENAYMVYCQIINKLILFRWMDEKKLGLDYTMRLTHDWRVKQDVLVNAESLEGWFSNGANETIRKQFKTGLYEDLKEENRNFKPQYSIDSDKTISGLTKNFTPEKSDILLRLTAFEDVKYIYQAIIAKLFVIEKMEASGITQSSIDAAEAEFMTLYSVSNYDEKYLLAADFFSKFASILYYKNTILSLVKGESVYTTLYLFDIDILALIDDYCYHVCNIKSSNAIKVKDDIMLFLSTIKTSEIIQKGKEPSCFKALYFAVISSYSDCANFMNRVKKNGNSKVLLKNAFGYLKYLDKKHYGIIDNKWGRLKDCYERRRKLTEKGCKLPCTACKYANRSMVILMKHLFGYEEGKESKVITLLRNSSHKTLQNLRPEILSQLAYSSEQLADIMMSCAYTIPIEERRDKTKGINPKSDILSINTVELLISLSHHRIVTDEDKRQAIDVFLGRDLLGNINRALLYYWAAFRYYDIASMHHEAVHCIRRITCVIEKYLTVLLCNNLEVPEFILKEKSKNIVVKLLNQLFTQASRIVSRQYDNYNSVEIHELKWLLHFEHVDDIDLTQLTLFPNLQSIFVSIVNSNVLINSFRIKEIDEIIKNNKKKGIENEYDNEIKIHREYEKNVYVKKIYFWITRNRHNCTFQSDVELNFLKATINHYIFDSIVGGVFDLRRKILNLKTGKMEISMSAMHKKYYRNLKHLLDKPSSFFEKELFDIPNDAQSRLDLLDFLIEDSITCLCNIINSLPPHNQFTIFSNGFIANVYSDLWEWSKFNEMMNNAYVYYRYYIDGDALGMEKMKNYNPIDDNFDNLAKKMKEKGVVYKDNFGYRYSKLNMNLRHDVDDATIHRLYINYSAEMAIKYYRAARGINSEGQEYKNLINTMYMLDDDLRNDTCQSNLADERYLINSDVINNTRLTMQNLYKESRTNRIDSFENYDDVAGDEWYSKLQGRYVDSIYTNTEYK